MKFDKKILAKAKKIRLLAMDVNGVLTAGEIIVLNSGEEIKIWNVKDRMGFAILRYSVLPFKSAWITARKSLQVENNAKDLRIDFLRQKCLDKGEELEQVMKL